MCLTKFDDDYVSLFVEDLVRRYLAIMLGIQDNYDIELEPQDVQDIEHSLFDIIETV